MRLLLDMLIESGYPKNEIYHHNSDLYIFVTPETEKTVSAWCRINGFNQGWHCPKFKDQITGKMMFDCAFCYYDLEAGNND